MISAVREVLAAREAAVRALAVGAAQGGDRALLGERRVPLPGGARERRVRALGRCEALDERDAEALAEVRAQLAQLGRAAALVDLVAGVVEVDEASDLLRALDLARALLGVRGDVDLLARDERRLLAEVDVLAGRAGEAAVAAPGGPVDVEADGRRAVLVSHVEPEVPLAAAHGDLTAAAGDARALDGDVDLPLDLPFARARDLEADRRLDLGVLDRAPDLVGAVAGDDALADLLQRRNGRTGIHWRRREQAPGSDSRRGGRMPIATTHVAFRSRQLSAGSAPRRPSWVARARAGLRARTQRGVDLSRSVAAILDLFEEHFYVGDDHAGRALRRRGRQPEARAAVRRRRCPRAPSPARCGSR